jgi:hypothetical protein
MDYIKGVLVKNNKGELGIVTDDRRNKLLILLGDGLNIEDDRWNWEPVPFGENKITCCFVELLGMYDYAPDIRLKYQEQLLKHEKLEQDMDRLYAAFNDLEERVEDLDGIKNKTTRVLTQ